MPTSLASIDNQELLRRSSPSEHNLWFRNPVEEVATLIWVIVINVLFFCMLLSQEVTMNDNGSATFPSLLLRKLKIIDHVVVLFGRITNDVDFVSYRSCSRRLVACNHDNFYACLFAGEDRLINTGPRRIIEGYEANKGQIKHWEPPWDALVTRSHLLPGLPVLNIELVLFLP